MGFTREGAWLARHAFELAGGSWSTLLPPDAPETESVEAAPEQADLE